MYDKSKLIKGYIKESEMRLELSNFAYEKESYNTSIRECQDCIELLIKSLLISYGQYIPEKHNLKNEFREISELLSEEFQKKNKTYMSLITTLRRERERSYYGDVENNITPQELYSNEDAIYFISKTKDFLFDVKKELNKYLGES